MVSQGPVSALPSPTPMLPEMLRTRSFQPLAFCCGERYLSAGHLYTFLVFAKYAASFEYFGWIRKLTLVLSVQVASQFSQPTTHGAVFGSLAAVPFIARFP